MIHYWVKAIPGETSILDPLRHSVLAIKYLDGVIAAWPSRSDKESETLQLNDGRIITAKNVRRFNFIDIPKIESLTAIDDGIVF